MTIHILAHNKEIELAKETPDDVVVVNPHGTDNRIYFSDGGVRRTDYFRPQHGDVVIDFTDDDSTDCGSGSYIKQQQKT